MEFHASDTRTNTHPKTCLIIGGGMSGLIAGTVLQRHGMFVTVLDKGRGIGGRLATRRISHPSYGEGVFDYGAQFFAVSHPSFQTWVDQWLRQGLVSEWARSLSNTGKPCYCGIESNRSIAQYLAKDLDVYTKTRATRITWESSYWIVQTEEDDSLFQGNSLILTAPLPQIMDLLDQSGIVISLEIRNRLEGVIYHPCIAILALLERPSLIPEPGGLQLSDPSLKWIACNQKKGISPQGAAVTLHATPEFSHTHWSIDERTIADKLFHIASPWLGSTVVEYQVHRWRYSQPQTCYGDPYLALKKPGLLMMAGDAFSSSNSAEPSLNLEKAALSGLEAAKYLLEEAS